MSTVDTDIARYVLKGGKTIILDYKNASSMLMNKQYLPEIESQVEHSNIPQKEERLKSIRYYK